MFVSLCLCLFLYVCVCICICVFVFHLTSSSRTPSLRASWSANSPSSSIFSTTLQSWGKLSEENRNKQVEFVDFVDSHSAIVTKFFNSHVNLTCVKISMFWLLFCSHCSSLTSASSSAPIFHKATSTACLTVLLPTGVKCPKPSLKKQIINNYPATGLDLGKSKII